MPLVVPLIALLAALMLLLAWGGAFALAKLIAKVLGYVPLIGPAVAGAAETAIINLAGDILAEYDAVTAGAGWVFAAVSAWAWQHMWHTSAAIQHVNAQANQAQNTAQGALYSAAQLSQAAEAQAEAHADHLYNLAVGYAGAVAIEQAQRVYAASHAETTALAGTVEGDYLAAVHDVESVAGSLAADLAIVNDRINALEQTLAGDITTAEAGLVAGIAKAIAQAQADANAALATAEHVGALVSTEAANGAVGALNLDAHDLVIGPWAALLPEVAPVVDHLPADVTAGLGLPGILGGTVPATIPAILAGVIPVVSALAAEIDGCVIPQCQNLGNLSRLFQAFAGAGFTALILALIEEAARNPGGAVADIDNTVAGAADEIFRGLRDIVGV